ncbi:aminoacyl tRNA synthase complex-interacting multifunctional protein 1-like [Asterias rubens]|uniref:aminoacyl tRNA synthase complex-interacting multifunctional protein 1-like n=1 Tax=Asterias rubens TaxID=7604 RepID=UPI0014553206|nr:aminoacyl tRNA synthase complex-interacting multifunctional protein 1-like [Asterias rubens]
MFLVRGFQCTRLTMSANSTIVNRLQQRAQQADDIIARLKLQLADLKKTAAGGGNDATVLQAENTKLQADIKNALNKLVALENSHGILQIPLPNASPSPATNVSCNNIPKQEIAASVKGQTMDDDQSKPKQAKKKQAKAEKKEKKEGAGPPGAPVAEPDITAVDLRIGRILEVKRHPDADTLYIEQIELGEGSPRTVVSGLVNHVKIEEMENRMVILCCNLKPAKMRGVLSQAMVMCAATPDKVELLIPPKGVEPGDRVSCEGYELGAFPPQMNPKKKIFEQIKPHLRTNASKVACYKGGPFKVEGKGVCVAPSLIDAEVR